MAAYDIHKAIEKEAENHRTIPLWSWNNQLQPDELKEQIRQMREAGIGGYFMHARAGLTTPYMQDEWMKAVATCVDEGEAQNMESWLYDENGWPSGFANGAVPQMGEDYQQKGLDCVILNGTDVLPDKTLGVYRLEGDRVRRVEKPSAGDVAVYVVVNRYYIDALNPASITHFLEHTHERYYAQFGDDFGTRIKGFFTDEPQYANGLIPWSPCVDEAFADEWGYNPQEKLGAFFMAADGEKAFRWQYYQTAARLFQEGFIRQMGEWCRAHKVQLTGHVMNEDSLLSQIRSTGGVMADYEYFDMPGIDWLGRKIASPVIPKQLGSAAAQLGKKRTLTESYALCGWDVSFNELRWIAQWQYVNGINLICQHLSAYSLQGLRKRDYPASLSAQQPWFEAYKPLQDYFDRTGAALAEGKDATDVLLLQPLGDAAGNHNRADEARVNEIADRFDRITAELSGQHLLHHYGDETLLKRFGKVSDGKLVVGEMTYQTVILPYCESIAPSTAALLSKMIAEGGRVIAVGHAPVSVGFETNEAWLKTAETIPVVDDVAGVVAALDDGCMCHVQKADGKEEQAVHLMHRVLPDGRDLYYVTSLSLNPLNNRVLKIPRKTGLAEIDLRDNSEKVLSVDFDGTYTTVTLPFDAAESHLLISCDDRIPAKPNLPEKRLSFAPMWEIAENTPNTLTLDKALYRVDGGEWHGPKAIILIQQELLRQKHPCHIDLQFVFTVDHIHDIGHLELVLEQPELYTITLNGQTLPFTDNGWYCDKSFRRTVIREYVREGENTLLLSGEFFQRQEVYDILFGENVHEAERNKLTFDTELESLYILGDFSTKADVEPEYGDRRAVWAGENFALCPPLKQVTLSDITTEGFWFFAGKLRAKQDISIHKEKDVRYFVEAEKLNVPAARVYVNGVVAGLLYLAPFRVDVTDFLVDGGNTVEIELLTGNRNLLGPHHRSIGESYFVAPATFTDCPDWEGGNEPSWKDNYCFVTTGVILKN